MADEINRRINNRGKNEKPSAYGEANKRVFQQPDASKIRKSSLKRSKKSLGQKVRSANTANALKGLTGQSVNVPRTSTSKGGGVSLGIDVKPNYASWARSMRSIDWFENQIHKIGTTKGRAKGGRATHFHGVKTMMKKMFARSEACIPAVLPIIYPTVQAMMVENFMTNGLPSGGWAPLSPKYAAFKVTRYGPMPTMIATGELFASLTTGLVTDKVTNTSVEFANKVRYSKWHQYGTTRMPMRRLVYEAPGFANEVGEAIANFVHGVSQIGSRI